MKAKGVIVDGVCKIGGVAIDGLIPSDWLKLGGWKDVHESVPESFWRILVADRGSQGNRLPNWYKRTCMQAWSTSWKLGGAFDISTALGRGPTPNRGVRTQSPIGNMGQELSSQTCFRLLGSRPCDDQYQK